MKRERSPETVAFATRMMNAILASPRFKRFQEQWQRALAGDREALIEVIDDSGIETLDDEDLKRQIYSLSPAVPEDRKLLERIAKSLRKYLLSPRRGRPPKTPKEAAQLIAEVQSAFESCRIQFQRTYRNEGTRNLHIKSISEHVSRAVPEAWRESIERASKHVLNTRPAVKKTFGLEVVAKAFSRSSRHLRSIRKTKGTGSNA